MLKEVNPESMQPMGKKRGQSREKCEEGEAAERNYYGLTATPMLVPYFSFLWV